jgi:hypothetical protein
MKEIVAGTHDKRMTHSLATHKSLDTISHFRSRHWRGQTMRYVECK